MNTNLLARPLARDNAPQFSLREIAHALGGEVTGGEVLAPGPGHSRRDRSLSVRLSDASALGFIAHSFAGDDWRTCRDHICRALGIATDARREPRRSAAVERRAPAADDHTGPALALWRAACDPRGTPAERYLNIRGLTLGDDVAGRALRWHEPTRALLGIFRAVLSGEPRAVTRTFLTADARKVDRRFLGRVGGAAIQFDRAADGLTVAEGIETALTARALSLGPTWAVGSAGAIAALPIVPSVARLRIVVERDANGVSERAATACAERWRAAGRAVALHMPPTGCCDLNDSIRQDRQ